MMCVVCSAPCIVGNQQRRMQHEAYEIVHPSGSIKRTVARIVSETKYPSPYESLDPPIGKPQEGPDEDAGFDVADVGGKFEEQEGEGYVAEDIQGREDGIAFEKMLRDGIVDFLERDGRR